MKLNEKALKLINESEAFFKYSQIYKEMADIIGKLIEENEKLSLSKFNIK